MDDSMEGSLCFIDENTNVLVNSTSCQRTSSDLMFLLVGIPIPIISIIINSMVLLAAGLQRQTLRRHNYVFSSVCSTLVSNMLYAILSMWTTVGNYLRLIEDSLQYRPDNKVVTEKFWIARNAAIICLLLAMCGNIGSLVYVLMDSTYVVRKKVDRETVEQSSKFISKDKGSKRLSLYMTKRRKAHLLIGLSWSLPVLLVLLATFTKWNCANCCCRAGRYTGDPCPVAAKCSRFWSPMTHSFLGIFLGLWIVEVVFLIWLVRTTFLKFRKVASDDPETGGDPVAVSSVNVEAETSAKHSSAENQGPINNIEKIEEPEIQEIGVGRPSLRSPRRPQTLSTSSMTPMKEIKKKKAMLKKFSRKLNSKLKSMVSLLFLFLCFTVPVILGILVDFTTGAPMPGKDALIVISELSTYFYTLICPFILLKFMPRLKLSVIMCVYKCCKKCGF